MTVGEQIHQQVQHYGGAYGAAGTGGGVAWFVSAAEPLMKLVSFSLSSAVAILTVIWLVKKIRGTGRD